MRALNVIRRLNRDTRGMSTVEYAVLLVLIVAGSVGIWRGIGQKVANSLKTTEVEMTTQMGKLQGQQEP